MHTLTKLFIVLLVIFSIAFSMMTVQYVATSKNFRAEADSYKELWQIAQNQIRQSNTQLSQIREIHDRETRDLNQVTSDLRERLDNALTKEISLRSEKAALDAENDSLKGNLGQFAVALEGNVAERDQLNELLAKAQRQVTDLQRKMGELEEATNRLTTENEQASIRVRSLKEVLRDLQRQSESAGVPLGIGPGDYYPIAPPMPTSSPISGTVVQVQGGLAEISVGESDGVRAGMRFIVYRGDDYLSDLEIDRTDVNNAAGRLILTRGEVRPGDLVSTGFE